MIQDEQEIRALALRLYGRTDWDDSFVTPASPIHDLRGLVCTPYDGAYGRAGWVIAINGSPPRGTFITTAYEGVVYISSDGRSRRLQEKQAEIVNDFIRERERIKSSEVPA